MSQSWSAVCPRCGATAIPNQRFCPNCGLPASALAMLSSQEAQPVVQPLMPSQRITDQNRQTGPTMQTIAPGPLPAAAPLSTRPRARRRIGRSGCIVLVLVLLLLIGAGAYFAVPLLGMKQPSTPNQGYGGTQPPVTTSLLQTTVTYAGVDVTVLDAQQAKSFVDDPETGTSGMLRLHLQAQNKTSVSVSWSYTESVRLLLPGNKSIAPLFVKAQASLDPGVTQTSVIDFAVSASLKIGQMMLVLGTAREAQMLIPLTSHPDVSKYAPKTVTLNGQLQYIGLNYNLTSASWQLSIPGKQASKGMAYIIMTLQVDNPLSQEAIPGSAFDYVRLQSGTVTATPQDATLPVSFAAGATGSGGSVTFLMPQGSAAFTLLLLATSQSGFNQATANFQFA